MDSAFDGVTPEAAANIRKQLLAGHTMTEIRNDYIGADGKPEISIRAMRAMRDEVFDPLICDPEKVKSLANGPVLNANEIVRYRQRPGRKPRMARPGDVQTEMFG